MDNSESNTTDLHQDEMEDYSSLLTQLHTRINLLRPFQRRQSIFLNIDNIEDLDSDSLCDSFCSSSLDNRSKNSNDEIIGFDYKSYPITIDWLLIDNDKHYHSIFVSRGALGVILINCLSKQYKINQINDNLLSPIVNTYITCLKSSKETIEELMTKLPKLNEFITILLNKFYTNKETVLLKIIIDFQCCYLKLYNYPLYKNLNDWLIIAKAFYTQLSEEEIQLIFNEITNPSYQLKEKISIMHFNIINI